jgi:hypothetical protein
MEPSGRILGHHDPRRRDRTDGEDLGAAHHPTTGPYDSGDPAVILRQLRLARAAGLDGFVVSVWGRESRETALLGPLARAAQREGLVVAPYYEAAGLAQRGPPGVARDLEALLDRHGGEPGLLRVGGRPVVFVYGARTLRPGGWEVVRRRLARSGRDVYLVGDSRHPRWLSHFDALHVYTPTRFLTRGVALEAAYREWQASASRAGIPFFPAVTPGYDDRRIRVPGTRVPRDGGATYDATWQAALAIRPPWVLITSWNEWHEGTEIEESLEHGRLYLDVTRTWTTRFRGLAGTRRSGAQPSLLTSARMLAGSGSSPLP